MVIFHGGEAGAKFIAVKVGRQIKTPPEALTVVAGAVLAQKRSSWIS